MVETEGRGGGEAREKREADGGGGRSPGRLGEGGGGGEPESRRVERGGRWRACAPGKKRSESTDTQTYVRTVVGVSLT